MNTGSVLGPLSLMMKGEEFPEYSVWQGIPATVATTAAMATSPLAHPQSDLTNTHRVGAVELTELIPTPAPPNFRLPSSAPTHNIQDAATVRDEHVMSDQRVPSVDVLKGAALVLTALLNTFDVFQLNNDNVVRWTGPLPSDQASVEKLGLRIAVGIALPAMLLCLGIGVGLFVAHRRQRDWSTVATARHFVGRTLLVLCCGRLVQIGLGLPKWLEGEVNLLAGLGSFSVDVPLASSLLFLGSLTSIFARRRAEQGWLPRSPWNVVLILGGVGLSVASNMYVVGRQGASSTEWPAFGATPSSARDVLERLLMLPGRLSSENVILHPIVPWLPVAMVGCAMTDDLRVDRLRLQRRNFVFALICLTIAVGFRLLGGSAGNFRGPSRNEETASWLTLCEYPPSPSYLLGTLSVVLVLLIGTDLAEDMCLADNADGAASSTRLLILRTNPLRWLGGLGHAPLCFWVAHTYLVAACYGTMRLFVSKTSVEGSYAAGFITWALVVALMHRVCGTFSRMRLTADLQSAWRLF
eukprot:NODE_791_length_1902_cov_28.943875_g730_i0.p1 GENE.NODE_791_length_1902_cov_28.943875_g730_i0~~NODE_791_length_1902_cov_28.943875_g730_i0.p1  ORF type:complete len:577 (-),score=67.25 NODE_791_length_1902_cov_28.943875_g730_i0:170-1744(-)